VTTTPAMLAPKAATPTVRTSLTRSSSPTANIKMTMPRDARIDVA
jgi:hypothetical protein